MDLQWIPGHACIPGNEIADEVARQAAAFSQECVPINLDAAKARIKLHLRCEWAESLRGTKCYSIVGPKKVPLGDKVGLNRAEGVAVARLRTNNSLALRAYRAKIQLEADSTCTGCDDGVPEDNEHLLTGCPATARLRREIFGRDDPTLAEVFADPHAVVAYLRRLGHL